MKKPIRLAVASALLLSQWAWVQQVLAAKTANLSISAVVTGNCRILAPEGRNGYRVQCSGGAQHPLVQTSSGNDADAAPANNAPRLRAVSGNGSSNGSSNSSLPTPVTTLVY
ncbi:hypothetical protein [Herbaspirillum robiniae]|uniref:Uncharacterized protein n=1 Tax=Herbaspirillum robiniae TaxID=2014887 RepID=A0ABX2LRE6_9BURK|nr:hypothetical protein [Herbaspirillum robiniae]NUU01130.1 hypothetical protein [Herbaspirillum robiniae]